MRIALLDINLRKRGCINKDAAGGFGTATVVGNSFPARILELVKKKGVKLPLISLGYLAAIFKKAGHNVEYVTDKIPNADLVIIQSSIIGYKIEQKWAKLIKEKTNAKVGFIGPFATAKPDLFLSYSDFIIEGEPEEAAEKIANGLEPKDIIKSQYIKNLDNLSFPDWDPFPVKNYSYFPTLPKRPFLTILSSRGCPLSCSYYCPYTFSQGRIWRPRTPENVIDEIGYLTIRYNIKSLMFRDPMFSLDRERVLNIAEEILRRNIKIDWGCETCYEYLDIDLLKILKRAGLKTIEMGVESTNENNLKDIHRSLNGKEKLKEIVNFCNKQDIKTVAFYMLGLPNETKEDIKSTIKFAKKLPTFAAQFTILTPYPLTLFYEDVKEKINNCDWEELNGYSPTCVLDGVSRKDLIKLKKKAFLNYNFSPKQIVKFLSVLNN